MTTCDLQKRLEQSLRLALDVNGSPEYALTWKTWDMQSGPPICALRASGRRTYGSACSGELSGWATPAAQEAGGTPEQFLERKRRAVERGTSLGVSLTSLSLQAQLAGWGTPSSRDHKDSGSAFEADPSIVPVEGRLARQVMLAGYPTHQASNADRGGDSRRWKGEQSLGGRRSNLIDCVMAVDTSGPDTISSPAATGKRGALNPRLSAWLQGYPVEWDTAAILAHRSMSGTQRNRG